MDTKVAVVTGANKGIGFYIVKGLCERFSGKVYLTARDEHRGKQAVYALEQLGLHPVYHQLDINDQNSVDNFRQHILNTDGGIDILVNNAGFAYKSNTTEPFGNQAEDTVNVNYFGTLRVCNALFPILRSNSQVVNVSSVAGHLYTLQSAELREKFGSKLSVDDLSSLIRKFVSDAKNGTHLQKGWGHRAYAVSKVGISALSIIQQRDLDTKENDRNVSVNFVHPGYVRTDMTSNSGNLTPEEGARAPLFLALGGHALRGQFVWHDCRVVDWYSNLPEFSSL